jgi:hypothetical protein
MKPSLGEVAGIAVAVGVGDPVAFHDLGIFGDDGAGAEGRHPFADDIEDCGFSLLVGNREGEAVVAAAGGVYDAT